MISSSFQNRVPIQDVLVNLDKQIEQAPFVATLANVVNVVQKVFLSLYTHVLRQEVSNRYWLYLLDKSYMRCITLLIPFIGNLIVIVFDACQEDDNSEMDTLERASTKAPDTIESSSDEERSRAETPLAFPKEKEEREELPDDFSGAVPANGAAVCSTLSISTRERLLDRNQEMLCLLEEDLEGFLSQEGFAAEPLLGKWAIWVLEEDDKGLLPKGKSGDLPPCAPPILDRLAHALEKTRDGKALRERQFDYYVRDLENALCKIGNTSCKKWMKSARLEKDPIALSKVALYFVNIIPKFETLGLKVLQSLADQGCPEALFSLGIYYLETKQETSMAEAYLFEAMLYQPSLRVDLGAQSFLTDEFKEKMLKRISDTLTLMEGEATADGVCEYEIGKRFLDFHSYEYRNFYAESFLKRAAYLKHRPAMRLLGIKFLFGFDGIEPNYPAARALLKETLSLDPGFVYELKAKIASLEKNPSSYFQGKEALGELRAIVEEFETASKRLLR